MTALRLRSALLVSCLALGLSGCEAARGNKQTIGTVGGGVAGAVAGNAIGRAVGGDNAAILGTVLGGLLGGAIGNQIGAALDEADAQQAAQATQYALQQPVPNNSVSYGPPITWRSQSNQGVYGSSQLVDVGALNGQECRRVRELAVIRGEEVQQESVYCRSANGSWELTG